ncbi:MAG: heavy metal translocating P-type ATPase [Tissierellia bacterium]|nr:heavy metal translocating P-type ATPase [Tissierellia bacterium]
MKDKFAIEGMTCSACALTIEKKVSALDGVQQVNVNLLSNSMSVEYDGGILDPEKIMSEVGKAGYGAQPMGGEKGKTPEAKDQPLQREADQMRRRAILSFLFMIPLMYLAMGEMVGLPIPGIFKGLENSHSFAFVQFLLTIPVVFVNRSYYINGFKALFHRSPNMDSLIALGSGAALSYGVFVVFAIGYGLGHGDHALVHRYMHSLYFESAAMILALITLGKYLEARSKGRTTDAIRKLMDLAPKTAIRLNGDVEEIVPVEELRVGDRLLVKPGASIPVDGIVIAGIGSVDQAAITGESVPVEVAQGDQVIGSTILQLGSLQMEAQRVGEDTTLAKIIQLVQDANATKAPISKLADRISGVFVPVVIALAILSTLVWLAIGESFEFALTIGISILVISCPCALGLATPVAIMVGTGKAATNKILFKNAESLERLHEVTDILLDKTGTITEGSPSVTEVIPVEGITEEELLKIAAALEAPSEHPLSLAIQSYVKDRGLHVQPAEDFLNILGKGIQGKVQGKLHRAGNLRFMQEQGLEVQGLMEMAEELSIQGKTPLFFADENQLLGLIAVADPIKKTSKEAIRLLREQGIRVHMLTGDNWRTAEAIRSQLDIDDVQAEVLPEDKEAVVRRRMEEGGVVAMVGDGINDAPALARSDVGIAIGAGTDIAIESADVVLIRSDLMDLIHAIDLSQKTIRNIKQNLFWAFFYNVLCIPLAAGVFYPAFGLLLNPMIASAAMSISSIFVVTNALRLNRFRKRSVEMGEDQGDDPIRMSIPETMIAKPNNGGKKMKKTIKIEGMTCSHCSGRVDKALNAIEGVQATVDLDRGTATVEASDNVTEEQLRAAIEDAGYIVTGFLE